MERALAVIDDTDAHRRLLAEAGQMAKATGAELVLFSWATPVGFEDDAETLEAVESAEHTTFSGIDALDGVRGFAREFAGDVLGGDGSDFDVTAVVTDEDDLADEILDAADRLDCDHVFVVGRRRSPTGKVIFGDVAQRVILNFDGPVTVTMD